MAVRTRGVDVVAHGTWKLTKIGLCGQNRVASVGAPTIGVYGVNPTYRQVVGLSFGPSGRYTPNTLLKEVRVPRRPLVGEQKIA